MTNLQYYGFYNLEFHDDPEAVSRYPEVARYARSHVYYKSRHGEKIKVGDLISTVGLDGLRDRKREWLLEEVKHISAPDLYWVIVDDSYGYGRLTLYQPKHVRKS